MDRSPGSSVISPAHEAKLLALRRRWTLFRAVEYPLIGTLRTSEFPYVVSATGIPEQDRAEALNRVQLDRFMNFMPGRVCIPPRSCRRDSRGRVRSKDACDRSSFQSRLTWDALFAMRDIRSSAPRFPCLAGKIKGSVFPSFPSVFTDCSSMVLKRICVL